MRVNKQAILRGGGRSLTWMRREYATVSGDGDGDATKGGVGLLNGEYEWTNEGELAPSSM